MSRKNKVNPDHYKVAGRLSPDDLARERIIQSAPQIARAWDSRPGQPAWMDNRSAGPGDESEAGPRAKRLPAGARRVQSGAKARAKKQVVGTGRSLSPSGHPPRSRRGTQRRASTRRHLSGGGKRPARRAHGRDRAEAVDNPRRSNRAHCCADVTGASSSTTGRPESTFLLLRRRTGPTIPAIHACSFRPQ